MLADKTPENINPNDQYGLGLELTIEQEFELRNMEDTLAHGFRPSASDVLGLMRMYFSTKNALRAAYKKLQLQEFTEGMSHVKRERAEEGDVRGE